MQTIKITHLTGINKDKEEFFTNLPIKIGSLTSNDLVFEESEQISPHHATLLLHNEKYALINYSEHGTYINNKAINKVYIKDDIEIQIGKDGPIFKFDIVKDEKIEQDFVEVDEILDLQTQQDFTEKKLKDCPYCLEEVEINAVICQHCDRNITVNLDKKGEPKTKKKQKLPLSPFIAIFTLLAVIVSCGLCILVPNEKFKNIAKDKKNSNNITQQPTDVNKNIFQNSLLPKIKGAFKEKVTGKDSSKILNRIKKQNKYYIFQKSEYNDDLVLILSALSCALTTTNMDGNFEIPTFLDQTIKKKGYDDLFIETISYVCIEGDLPEDIKKCLSNISEFPTYQTKATSYRNPTTNQNITINKPYNYTGLYLLLEPTDMKRYEDFYNANNNKLLKNYTPGWIAKPTKVDHIFPFLNDEKQFLEKLKILDPELTDKLIPKTEVIVDDTLYKLESYKFSDYIGNSYYGKNPDGKFLIIKLYVKNQSNSTQTIGLSSSTIVDSSDREYRTSSEGSTALTMSGDETAEFLLTEIQPNLAKQITIVFDISPDETLLKLKIPGKWGNYETITIGD